MTTDRPTPIATTTPTPSVDAARRLLAAALDGDPTDDPTTSPTVQPPAAVRLAGDDGRTALTERLAVAEALAVLDDVTPPHPPLPAHLAPVPVVDARRLALAHLDDALHEVTSVRDLTRVGLAALVLRRGGGVAA